eukprot:CAMPEP_0184532014 /NCGR_PEP_ID=MMETSP0198_2-20121128/13905_1 /TAXON_ID=1112570 /ORGANISM="Thraustochytrium sp., Strain LLF1b" /LENGTH=472 /DNA_ID=CAMNT_0026924511 /DNA_START=94 /DNA_END=1513 /DNA_ORIENTATION=+
MEAASRLQEEEAELLLEKDGSAREGNTLEGLKGDYGNVALLLLLYMLQGVPLGLSQTMDLILQEKKLSFDEQGVFSFVSWPYSLKVLWAPIVDTVYVRAFGRRKSWLVPIQILIGALMIITSQQLDSLLGEEDEKPNVYPLTAVFFVFYLLAATQDVALDGWAVTMLSRRNIGYASTCNAVGQTLGFFVAFTGYLGLNSYNLCTLQSFMFLWGIAFIAITLGVALLKHEKTNKQLAAEAKLSGEEDGADAPENLRDAYQQMGQVLRLPGVLAILSVLFTRGIAFASADSLAQRKLMERGLKKEHIAAMMVLVTPLNIVLPGLVSKQTTDRPLSLFKRAYLPRVASASLAFFIALALLVIVQSVLSSAMFVSIMAFFAQVSDPAIGGTYMTMLNTMANLGGKWPNQFVLFMVDHLTWKTCDEFGACEVIMDGFVPLSVGCTIAGIVWYRYYSSELERLQDMEISKWRVNVRKD